MPKRLRSLDDGHLSPLDLEAIQGNLIDRLGSQDQGMTDLQTSQDPSPGNDAIKFSQLYNDIMPESAKAYQDMNSLDAVRLVSEHDHKMIAGMPAIEDGDLYFEVGAIDDNETLDPGSSSYGMRSGEELEMEATVRYHGSGGTIEMTSLASTASTVTILDTNGDKWKKLGGAWFGFDDYPSAQGFKQGVSEELVAVQIYAKCTDDTIPVDFRVELYANDEYGYPSLLPEDLKQYGETTAATVSLTGEWITIKFKTPFPRLGAERPYHIVIYATPSDPAKVVYWHYSEVGDHYADGSFVWYDRDLGRWEFVYASSDAYLKLEILTEETTTLVVNAAYSGWQEAKADVTLRLAHDLWEKSNFADFYLTVPDGMAVNALCLRDKASGGEAHWRCDHVRTRHINPNSLTLTAGHYTSTDWDGDAKNANGVIDLSSVFGVPAGVSAVIVRLGIKDETPGVSGILCKKSTELHNGVQQTTQVAGKEIFISGIVPCDGGDIYWYQNSELDTVSIDILGYWS